MMVWVRLGLLTANSLVFASLGGYMAWHARGDRSPRTRAFAWMVSGVCMAFVLGAMHRAALQAFSAGWLGEREADFLLAGWQVIHSLAAACFGVGAWVVIRRFQPDLRTLDRMVTVLTGQIPAGVSVPALALTARELQVLELIALGIVSDREIAEALYIAPSTVRTHIKHVLKKAGLSNRRQLMLLACAWQRDLYARRSRQGGMSRDRRQRWAGEAPTPH